VLAWFTKAAAAFFIAAIVIDASWTLWRSRRPAPGFGLTHEVPAADPRPAAWTIAGLGGTAAVIAALFVLPNWTEYQFYNWQMTVTRKPSYTLAAFVERASWLPIVQGIFTRTWLVVAGGSVALMAIVLGWREAKPAERLLALWVVIGFLELIAHDSGTERRYVMFIPAFVALAALLVGSGRTLVPAVAPAPAARWAALPIFLLLAYVVAGSLVRTMSLEAIAAGSFRSAVRASAVIAAVWALGLIVRWSPIYAAFARTRVTPVVAAILVTVAVAFNLFEYGQWAARAGDFNYRASIAIGRLVGAGTLVHGKLANGLALENRIRPIFIGNGFGNYEDRLRRDDVRYILTYTLPRVGYESGHEGRLMTELLAHYPKRRDVASFDVDETPAPDRATLIDKLPSARD
jgi:hypothetical protein